MSIDKFYRNFGIIIKRIVNVTVKKPIQDFNVENRAQKKIQNPNAAPWHDTTKKLVQQIKKESHFEEFDSKDNKLLDRLKSVKVDSASETNLEYEQQKLNSSRKLPKERIGAELPFVFYKPETIPPGKITVLDSFDIILSHKKENISTAEIAKKYNLEENDVVNLIKYVDIFTAIDKNNKEIPLFVEKDDDDSPFKEIDESVSKFKKEITDK